MPQAANLIIKNGANVDKTFTLITPAAGDSGVALWMLKEGTSPAVFPKLTHSAKPTGNKSRKSQMKYAHPATDSNNLVVSTAEANIAVSMPDDFPEVLRDDFIAYATNAFAHTLIKACNRDGYSAV